MVLLFAFAALISIVVIVYRLATLALPVLAGVAAGVLAYKTGAGVGGAIAVGFLASAVAIGLGQWLAGPDHPVALRLVVALVFAAPAAVIGYFLVHGLVLGAVPSQLWRVALSLVGAVLIGAGAFFKVIGPMPDLLAWRPSAMPPTGPRHVA